MKAPAHLVPIFCFLTAGLSSAQQAPLPTPRQELERLTLAVSEAQAQVEASQRQLLELRRSLADLQQRLAGVPATDAPTTESAPERAATPTAKDEVQEREAMQDAQIATLDQSKVETVSKYPLGVDGLILFNAFINTHAVDVASVPTVAVAGSGSVGASLRQTVLGIEARGPHIAGAASHADLHIDFFGSSAENAYADAGGLLRLRTAHAMLDWARTRLFVQLDRPIISPYTPTSLTTVAIPALAWSGNLWTWSPQVGASHLFDLGPSARLSIEAALIDVPDPPSTAKVPTTAPISQAQASRKPAGELRVALVGRDEDKGYALGVGGYVSRHTTPYGYSYNAWAATLDARASLPMGFKFSGTFYRGLALGGIGGGTYKDYLYVFSNGRAYSRALDDVGGWAQLKRPLGSRLEFNASLGLDNSFSKELRRYETSLDSTYQTIARNRSFVGNVIYSPSAYLVFSVEYRRISTYPIYGSTSNSNILGLAAGYKF